MNHPLTAVPQSAWLTVFLLMPMMLFPASAMAVDCSPANISLTSQTDIDNFQADYGGGGTCDTVTGDLAITATDATQLDGLAALTGVGGSVTIQNNGVLANVDGLSALTSVGGDFSVLNDDALTNVDGLSALASIGGSLTFESDAALADVDGLSALTSIGGTFQLNGNPALTNLDGLSALASAGGVNIQGNSALTNVDGLTALTGVTGDFLVNGNGALTDVDGLAALASVGGSVLISNEAALTNIDGLSALAGVSGGLYIYANSALPNVNGLSALTSVGGSLTIANNAAQTNVDGLAALTSVGGSVVIGNEDALTSIDGLAALAAVTGSFSMLNNDALTNVDGLSALASVGESVTIQGNGVLANLDGLSQLISVTGDFNLTDNPSLGNCTGLVDLLDTVDDAAPGPGVAPIPDVGGTVTLSGNLLGCNAVGEVLQLIDLAVTVTDVPDPVLAGSGPDNLTYTLELGNLGPWDASNVSVSVATNLPAGVTITDDSASAGTSFDGSTWTVGELPFGAPSVTLVLTLTVDASASSCTDCVSVTATATADQTDSDPGNNTDISNATSIERAADRPTSFTTTVGFTNGYDGTVQVTLTCNNGEPLQQTFDISPTLPVKFVVQVLDFLDPNVNCQVTLDALDGGYVGSSFTANNELTDGACLFSAAPEAGDAPFDRTTDRMNTCAILAEPVASTFEVSKRWLFEGNNDGSGINQEATIHIYCSPAATHTGSSFGQVSWWEYPNGDDDFSHDFYPSPDGGATCYALESGLDSAVESDQGCASGTDFEVGDGAKGCTITNTVFFEGIPTLSPYSLAILAVLTLGIGLLGFRRFA